MEIERHITLGYFQAHPVEAARHLESLGPQEAGLLLEALPGEEIANVLEHCLPVLVYNSLDLMQVLPI